MGSIRNGKTVYYSINWRCLLGTCEVIYFERFFRVIPLWTPLNPSKMLLKFIYDVHSNSYDVIITDATMVTSPCAKRRNFNYVAHSLPVLLNGNWIVILMLFMHYSFFIKGTQSNFKEISFLRFNKTGADIIVSERKVYFYILLSIYTPSRCNPYNRRCLKIIKSQ